MDSISDELREAYMLELADLKTKMNGLMTSMTTLVLNRATYACFHCDEEVQDLDDNVRGSCRGSNHHLRHSRHELGPGQPGDNPHLILIFDMIDMIANIIALLE